MTQGVWPSGIAIVAAVATAAIAAGACGGGGSAPTSPSSGGSGSSAATITITTSGVSPKTVTISQGSRVTFINNDTRSHTMSSNPHPDHTDCPPINDVGFITPGQTKLTGNLTTPRTCGFHDHDRESDTSLQGAIVIQ